MSIAWSHILLQFKQSLFIYFWSVSYLRGKFFRIKRLGLTTAIFTEGNDRCTGSWWNNEKDVWPEETGNSFIARWLVDAWSDMQKFFCAARSPLSIHPLAVPSYWTENSRLLTLSLCFFRFLAKVFFPRSS